MDKIADNLFSETHYNANKDVLYPVVYVIKATILWRPLLLNS